MNPASGSVPDPGNARLILVDQFEQLFTGGADPQEQQEFVERLRAHAARGIMVVIGMRADFYEHAVRIPALIPLINSALLAVGPMDENGIRQAIEAPARAAGIRPHPELVEILLRDLGFPRSGRTTFDAGALPLLSHALLQTTERAEGDELTLRNYQDTGGIHGAIAQTAEEVYTGLTDEQKETARLLFLNLSEEQDETGPTRRTLPVEDLFEGPSSRETFDRFVDARLITVDRAGAQLAHEVLLRKWPRLIAWLAEDAEDRRLRGTIVTAARTWEKSGHDEGSLLRGTLLQQAESRLDSHGVDESVRAFLRLSLELRDSETAARQALRRRRVRMQRALIALLTLTALVVGVGAGYASQARKNERRSQAVALSQFVAGESKRMRATNVGLAAQLAVAAYKISPTTEALESVLDSTAVPPARRLSTSTAVMALSADGRRLAEGEKDGTVRLWADAAGSFDPLPVPPLTGAGGPAKGMAASRDGHLLAAAYGRNVRVWSLAPSGRQVAVRTISGLPGTAVTAVAVSPDGRKIAAGSDAGAVSLWDVGSTTTVRLPGHATTIDTLAFAPDGRTLAAAGGNDHLVHLWNVTGGPLALAPLTGSASRIFSVAFSPDGQRLAAGLGKQHSVLLWKVDRPRPDGPLLTGPDSWVTTVAFSPDGRTLAAGAADNLLWLYDLATRRQIQRLPHAHPIGQTVFASGTTLLTRSDDNSLIAWTLPGPLVGGAKDSVWAVTFDATGTRMAVAPGAGDDSIGLWNTADPHAPGRLGTSIRGGEGADAFSGSGTLTPDGKMIAVGTVGGSVELWSVADPGRPRRLGAVTAANDLIEAITPSPDGRLLAIGSDDHTVRLVSIADPRRPAVLATKQTGGYVFQTSFSRDGRLLAVGSEDHHAYLLDVRDPTKPAVRAVLGGFDDTVYSTAFDPGGQFLAAGGADGTIRLWSIADPAHPVVRGPPLSGPAGYVYSLAFAPHGETLAAASTDGTAWLWNLSRPDDPRRLATLTGPAKGLLVVAFRPNGDVVAAGGHDRTVRFWTIDAVKAIRLACDESGLAITKREWAQYVPGRAYAPPCT
ncbi:WD40 repeat domain-containing protein [Actinomadura barringtoniae]|uniref:WD40 repeat domain-containing protein n=1 Tax=Actinomadura barringtoniae TaxID=1427535 RepID=A0A939PL96_9ACTN|nr:WD40 repeat domain-containing protein [Actinomadura barringtoniae]MBO2451964.1 WD40 repeat domain-containing protein [Actinomadura barringtoniae]